MAVSIIKDLNTMDLDKLMENVTPLVGGPKTSPSPNAFRKMQDSKDCLAADNQGNIGLPTYATKVPPKTKKGITMAGRNNSGARYLGRGFPANQSQSPGPIYQPVWTPETKRAPGFGKASRMNDTTDKGTPGPKYEVTSTLGSQLTRSSSPACKIGQAERFSEKLYISASHAKCGSKALSDAQVGPASYHIKGGKHSGPSYSFGSNDTTKNRFNDKMFISHTHAKSAGFGSSGPGPQPAITKNTLYGCNTQLSSKCARAPQFRFAANAFGTNPSESKKSTSNLQGKDSPGPGVYEPRIDTTKEKAPAFSFGTQGDSSKLYISTSLSADAKGRESPGPGYLPTTEIIQSSAPSFSFADPDPESSYWKSRFSSNRYIGSGIGMSPGIGSPGPAEYGASTLPAGPAFTMAKREKLLMKRICPAPDRPRFISKELAKENLGCYSPGPKYALPDTIGTASSTAYSFGVADRHFEYYDPDMKDKLGSVEKPYTSPAEARFISSEHSAMNRGKYGPGPKYNPADKVVRVFENGGANCTVTSYTHSVESRHHTAPSVSIGTKKLIKSDEDKREYHPVDRLLRKSTPGYGFGSASRYGTGPFTHLDAGAKGARMEAQDKRHIESSPGPGAFKPNYDSITCHTPGTSLGGLSAGFHGTRQKKNFPGRAKTASPTPVAEKT